MGITIDTPSVQKLIFKPEEKKSFLGRKGLALSAKKKDRIPLL
jgi:hypothetical protein